MSDKAAEIRKKYHYRWLLQSGRLKLPIKTARRLLGPDTAYHLYTQMDKKKGISADKTINSHKD